MCKILSGKKNTLFLSSQDTIFLALHYDIFLESRNKFCRFVLHYYYYLLLPKFYFCAPLEISELLH